MKIYSNLLLLIALASMPFFTQAQCGMGIPGAGNPGCVPPDVLNQQNQNSTTQQQPQTILIRHKWADRWGAIVVDDNNPVFGYSEGISNKRKARALAALDCLKKGGAVCKNKMFVYRNSCASMVAIKGGGAISQSAQNIQLAESLGLSTCEKEGKVCRVIYSGCSHAEAVPIH